MMDSPSCRAAVLRGDLHLAAQRAADEDGYDEAARSAWSSWRTQQPGFPRRGIRARRAMASASPCHTGQTRPRSSAWRRHAEHTAIRERGRARVVRPFRIARGEGRARVWRGQRREVRMRSARNAGILNERHPRHHPRPQGRGDRANAARVRSLADLIARAARRRRRRAASPMRSARSIAAGDAGGDRRGQEGQPVQGRDPRRTSDPAQIARSYESGGAACLSVLTDVDFFQGSRRLPAAGARGLHAAGAAQGFHHRSLPGVRGARARRRLHPADRRRAGRRPAGRAVRAWRMELGMDVLVEVHDIDELERALQVPAAADRHQQPQPAHVRGVAGHHAGDCSEAVPTDRLLVTESGIAAAADVARMRAAGVEAFLVGETFMRADDPGAALRSCSSRMSGCRRKPSAQPHAPLRRAAGGVRFRPHAVRRRFLQPVFAWLLQRNPWRIRWWR